MLKLLKKILIANKLSESDLKEMLEFRKAIERGEIHEYMGGEKSFTFTGTLKPENQDPSIKMVNVFDERGEFLPDMSEDEVLDYERKERMGWKDFKLPWQK